MTLIHRRDQFRAHEDSVAKMKCTTCSIKTFYELKSIGGDGQLDTATIFDNRTKDEEVLELDAVLVNIGFSNSLGPIKNWGLEIEGGAGQGRQHDADRPAPASSPPATSAPTPASSS